MENNLDLFNCTVFFEYLDECVNIGIAPTVVGYEKCAQNKEQIGPIIKTHYILHYVISGKGMLYIDKKEYAITEKTLFILPPGIKVSYKPDRQDPWKYLWLEFNGISSKPLCDEVGLTPSSPVFCPQNPDVIKNEFESIVKNSYKKNAGFTIFCTAKLLNIFSLLLDEIKQPKIHALNKDEYRILPIVEYIQQHYCDHNISLQTIAAEKMFFNASYLSRLFKKVMNMSPIRYVQELRMRKACEMLKSKAFTIATISESLGYNSPFYFSLEFKRIIGIAPSKYNEFAAE